uniref:Uncharacterized protein n=1 Tax=Cyanothece sp. (strain PCC 7425 / ATCC 29141) TaxID=395961 RepID=B8HZ24_CYAP4
MAGQLIRRTGLSVALGLQLLTLPASAMPVVQPLPMAQLGGLGGVLGELFTIAAPFFQSYSAHLLGGLNIGGIDLSNLVMSAVFNSGGVLGSSGLSFGWLLNTVGGALDPLLSQIPGGSQILSILTGLLNGSFNPQTLLNSGLLQKILDHLLAHLPPGGGNGNGGTLPGATVGGGGVLGTGSTTCLYASTCRPNPNPYQSVFKQATGVGGYPNPNEVRGKVYEAATSNKLLADVYASNPYMGAYYAGNQSDRDINRATTETVLSKAGQALQRQIRNNAQQTVQSLGDLVKNCAQKARSSQELIRCNLLVNGIAPSFDAAQLSVLMQMQVDDQFQKIQLGNISASMDAARRQRDIENAGLSISTLKAIWTTPTRW